MLKREKIREISLNFTSNKDDVMDSFRKNCFMIIEQKGTTIKAWAEEADVSFSTLNNFLYGNTRTCDIMLPVKLAKAAGVTVDELLGACTMSDGTKECVSKCRVLPAHFVNLARSYIRHIYNLWIKKIESEPRIVILPECRNGHLQTTNVTELIDISHLQREVANRVAHGLKIPCDHYEPYFFRDEIVLLAVDRDGQDGEMCIISHDGEYYIVRKKMYVENAQKKWKYMSLFTNRQFLKEDIDDKLGYVVGFLNADKEHSWGIR